jgi:hypothetical protein
MALAVVGITTVFQLSASAPTELAGPNNGRKYLLITNNDLAATVYIGFGTNNQAVVGMIPIPPSTASVTSYLELPIAAPAGDVSAIASSGTPNISYTEA